MSSASSIRSKARELGFEKVGFAPVGEAPRAGFLRDWLAREFHGEMAYMERGAERRMDPAKVLPGERNKASKQLSYPDDALTGGHCRVLKDLLRSRR